jgi:FAM192A/Fyv6, N-terminal domain
MQKRFVSGSTQIVDPALSPTSPTQSSPPQKPKEPEPDPNDKRSLFERLSAAKAKKQEAFEEAYKFSIIL